MQEHLKISVGMPSYNQVQYLEKSIQSVIDQNYPALELIVVDGGSTDGSVEIIKKYESDIYYWHSRRDSGQSEAINQGTQIATGDILCWLNSDDLHTHAVLRTVNNYFKSNNECQWLVGAGQFVDSSGQPMWPPQLPAIIDSDTMADWYKNMFHQPSVFWRRALGQQSGPLRGDFHLGMDYKLWLRFLKKSQPHLIPDLLSQATDHKDMKTRRGFDKGSAELCHALFINGYESEGRWAVEKIARKVFYLKRMRYPISRLGPVRKIIYQTHKMLWRPS